jgi:hypothetical protein
MGYVAEWGAETTKPNKLILLLSLWLYAKHWVCLLMSVTKMYLFIIYTYLYTYIVIIE